MSGTMPNKRRVCDRCYKYKEKCSFGLRAESCTTCQQAQLPCTTLRPQLRQGRRPRPRALGPNGSVQVWDIGNDSVSKKTGREMTLSHRQSSLSTSTTTDSLMHGSSSRIIRPNRLPYQVGRPEDVRKYISALANQCCIVADAFMFGPTFSLRYRDIIQRISIKLPSVLHNMHMIIIALDTVTQSKLIQEPVNKTGIAGAARIMHFLRTMHITSMKDAITLLSLGQTLAAFDLMTSGAGTMSIIRYTLSSVKPWDGLVPRDPLFDHWLTPPVFWDTVDCLVKREIPVIKHKTCYIVDPIAGLSITLLPLLYDLCVASNKLKYQSQSGSQINTDNLREIQQQLLSWTPKIPSNYTTIFSHQEVLATKTQASMYWMASLLVTHRILNPIGTQDHIAASYANSILSEYANYFVVVGPGTYLPYTAFPILMAAFEVPTVSKRIWQDMLVYSTGQICIQKMSDIIDYVWEQRRNGFAGFLLDLIEDGPDFIVVL